MEPSLDVLGEAIEVTKHKLGQPFLHGGQVCFGEPLVQQRVCSRRKAPQMIGSGSDETMKIPLRVGHALCCYGFKGLGSNREGRAPPIGITALLGVSQSVKQQ